MNVSIRTKLTRASHWLWHCLWVSAVFVMLTGGSALAVPVDIPGPNSDYTINAEVGQVVTGEDIGTNGSGNVFWGFDPAPSGCSNGGTSFICNGVTITLPTGSPGPVSGTLDTTVSGTPTMPGSFSFALLVTEESTGNEGRRNFVLDITDPAVPFDVSFALDRSGSMGSSANVDPPATTRWSALTNAVNGFTPLIESAAALIPGNSQFGLTLFGTNVLPNNSFPANLTNIDSNLNTNVNTELTSQTPGGSTAMGAGLKAAIAKMTDAARPRVAVLFTDGEQNQDPEVNLNGKGYNDGTSINASYPAGPGSIKVVTVGVGGPSGDYETTLQNLAVQNRGTYISTANGCEFLPPATTASGVCPSNVEEAFQFAIAPALSSNSPLMVDARRGTLSSEPVTLPAFELNHNLKQLAIALAFDQDFDTTYDWGSLLNGIRVLKDGTDITEDYFEPVLVGNSTNTVILKTNFVKEDIIVEAAESSPETIPSEGSYALQLTKPSDIKEDLNYRAVVYADDARLRMNWSVNPSAPRVNQPFNPTLNLSWRDESLTGATVEAFILKPGDDLGDLLARNQLIVDPSSARDAGSPGYQKYLQLLQNDPDFLSQLALQENQVTLADQGDGSYTAAVNPGDISGVSQVVYQISAKDPDLDSPIQRLAVQSVYTRFGNIDLSASSVDTSVVDDNTLQIDWRPMTTDGRFIGPDQGSGITVDGLDLTKIQDNQDGSYTLTLTGNPNAQISVKVLGEEVYKGQADRFGTSKKWPLWLIIAIIVFVLLLLILLLWFLKRRASESESDSES